MDSSGTQTWYNKFCKHELFKNGYLESYFAYSTEINVSTIRSGAEAERAYRERT